MNIDGQNTLACLCRIDRDGSKNTKIYPLPHSWAFSLYFWFHQLTECSCLFQCTSSRTSFQTWPSSTNNINPSNLGYKTITPQRKAGFKTSSSSFSCSKNVSAGEFLQSPEDRRKLDGMYECILCACCSTSCPSYWWNQDEYLGPATLMQTYRWIADSRVSPFLRSLFLFLSFVILCRPELCLTPFLFL